MNDEIKEILDIFKTLIEEYSPITAPFELENYEIEYSQIKSLLDYITNLQEENERLKLELSGYREAILRDDKLLGLKSRIDKAIEYMNNYIELEDAPINERIKIEFKEVIKLLNGGDEE